MTAESIYQDISERTGGAIYIGITPAHAVPEKIDVYTAFYGKIGITEYE